MAFVRSLFGNKPSVPETIPTDTIIPLFERDDSTTNRAVALEFTMVFDDVLDADKLSGALWRLLEKPGWKKLGGRLRLNKEGKLEYHVPAAYTKDRPPFLYTHETKPTTRAEHPIGKILPRPNGKLQVCDELGHLRVLTDTQSSMKRLEDWTNNDVGQLGLHITNLSDATFVTITWLHTLLDAMGRNAILRAWQAVLEGRNDDVPEFLGYNTNPLADIGKSTGPEEDFILAPKKLSGLGMARFGLSFLYQKFKYPNEEGRMIIVPGAYLTQLKAQALKDCETLDESKITYTSSEPKKPFLSDGDVLTAWVVRLAARTNPDISQSYPSRTIAISNIMGMREIMRKTSPPLLPKHGAYIHNCITAAWSHFAISDFLSKPLGHIAAQIRSDLVAQSTRAQIAAGQRIAPAMGAALYGTPDMVLANMTNWSKAKLFETDFSAAIVGGKGNGNGKPQCIQPFAHVNFYSTRGSANCIGKDGQGNWWLGAVMRTEVIEGFEREIKMLSEKGVMEM